MIAGQALALTHSTQREYAVAYQINPAHSGHVVFANGFTPPLTKLWSADFSGSYYGATYPLIADGKVFMVAYGNDLYAFNAQTGDTVWEHLFSGSGYQPAYDNGMLFLTDNSGRITSVNANNGRERWSVLPNGVTATHGAPIALNGVVYATAVSNSTLAVYGIDEATGAQKWWNLVGDSDYLTPAYGDGGVYLSYPCNDFRFSAADGALDWHYSIDGCYGGSGSTPSYHGKRVYADDLANSVLDAQTGKLLGGYPGTGTAAFFRGSDKRNYMVTTANGKLYCVDVRRGTVAWNYALSNGIGGNPIVVNNVVLVPSYDGQLSALDGMTGAQLWKGSFGGYGSNASLAAGDGVVAVLDQGTLTVFSPQ